MSRVPHPPDMGPVHPGTASGGPRRAYAPALDGVRALAVLAVLAYHAGWDALPGGFLGVDVFLVLSGYLITTLLLEERAARGRVSLSRFWDRRVRRLLPALAALVAAVVIHAAVTGASATIRGDAWATLTWVQNWHLALGDASYFAVFGEASPLRHAWSLALEAQWYLLWPLVLLALLRLSRGRLLPVAGVAAALAGTSAFLMARGFSVSADPSRIFYGTDTRGHVLLVGAVLALLLHRRQGAPTGWRWGVAGAAGVTVVGIAVHRLGDLDPGLYRGGFAVVAIGTAFVIVAALDARSPIGRLLALEPLPALGRISYGVYLWHWPLYLWLGPTLFAATLSLAAAAGSYVLLETPVRRAPLPMRRAALSFSATGAALVALAVSLVPLSPPVIHPTAPPPAPAVAPLPAGPISAALTGEAPRAAPSAVEVSRVLIAGDSVALTLGEHFRPEWVEGRFIVDYGAAFLGCGVVAGQPLNAGRPVLWSDPACLEWKARWRERIELVRPDVVVILLGAWEVMDRRIDGVDLRVGTAAYADYISEQLDAAFDLIRDAGLAAVVLTTPCFRPVDDVPGRSVSDRGDDGRVRWFNGVLTRAAAAHRSEVRVYDLHALLCPGGEQLGENDGAPLHPDGVHFTPAGSRYVWAWLAQQL